MWHKIVVVAAKINAIKNNNNNNNSEDESLVRAVAIVSQSETQQKKIRMRITFIQNVIRFNVAAFTFPETFAIKT